MARNRTSAADESRRPGARQALAGAAKPIARTKARRTGELAITELDPEFRTLALTSRNHAMLPFHCSRERLKRVELQLGDAEHRFEINHRLKDCPPSESRARGRTN